VYTDLIFSWKIRVLMRDNLTYNSTHTCGSLSPEVRIIYVRQSIIRWQLFAIDPISGAEISHQIPGLENRYRMDAGAGSIFLVLLWLRCRESLMPKRSLSLFLWLATRSLWIKAIAILVALLGWLLWNRTASAQMPGGYAHAFIVVRQPSGWGLYTRADMVPNEAEVAAYVTVNGGVRETSLFGVVCATEYRYPIKTDVIDKKLFDACSEIELKRMLSAGIQRRGDGIGSKAVLSPGQRYRVSSLAHVRGLLGVVLVIVTACVMVIACIPSGFVIRLCRQRLGMCTRCGYPRLEGARICPECGVP
jgi:hypothetical protein